MGKKIKLIKSHSKIGVFLRNSELEATEMGKCRSKFDFFYFINIFQNSIFDDISVLPSPLFMNCGIDGPFNR